MKLKPGYNGFGRRTSMSDPDMGSWSYGYSVLGNLTSQTDARDCVTTITYDDLNRPTGKTYTGITACDNTPDVTYTYDSITGGNEGLGRRTGMTDGSGSTTWFYNVLGQLTNETRNIESTNYSLSATFDAFSRPLTQTLPSGETLNYSYNAMGALSGLSGTETYLSQVHYNASGQVIDQLLGTSLTQQFCYNTNNLRLIDLRVYSGTLQGCVASPSSPRLRLSYTYQNNGNVSQIVDATRSETLTFNYDELDRLDTVSGPYSHNYDYNTIGNITSKNGTTYTYGDTAHKHAVTALSTGESYTYDANGNMTSRTEGGLTYTQTFDAENRLISVTVSGQTTQFVYDGDGNLVKKIKPDGSKTLYVGGIYEVDKNSGGTVTGTKTYYPAAGAMRIGTTLYFVLKDHLGSASVVTNKSGVIQGEDRFYPFGETRFTTGTMYTDKLFTGQREIAGLGIYHYGARFYSPKLGRFLSADTIVPGYANPQNLNRFSYVRNNPLRYTDPTGHLIDEGCGCANTGTIRRTVITVVAGRPTRNSDAGRTFVRLPDPPSVFPTAARTPEPESIRAPQALYADVQSGAPTSTGYSATQNAFATNPPIVSTQTPTPPLGWTPLPSFWNMYPHSTNPPETVLDTLPYDIPRAIIEGCSGPGAGPSCAEALQQVGDALPAIGHRSVNVPVAALDVAVNALGLFLQGCDAANGDCSIRPPAPYTPSYVTPSATPTFTYTPTMTPSPTLPYITPTQATPSSTSTYLPTPTP